MYIYIITNLATGLSYIGKSQTNSVYYMGSGMLLWNSYRKRFNNDTLNSRLRRCHRWVYEQNKKLGYYTKEILDTCDNVTELCELEKYYIKKYNTIKPNGYNIACGENGGHLVAGYTQEKREKLNRLISERTTIAMNDPEVKQRFLDAVQNKSDTWRTHISESLQGRQGHPVSEECKEKTRQRMLGNQYGVGNKSRTGYTNSKEMNEKISESNKKIPHTTEWNSNVSKALKGKKKSEKHKVALRKPKRRYKWMLPDGSVREMSASNGARHKDWIRLEEVFQDDVT